MKKLITLALVALLAFSVVGPAAAKKKKPKKPAAPVPVELQFFMRRDDCATDVDNPHLSLTDSPEDVECAATDAMLSDVYHDAGLVDPTTAHPAADGVPFTIDPSRKASGLIAIRSWNGAGAGQAVVDLEVVATVNGEEVSLGTFSETYVAAPDTTYEFPYELTLDPALAGGVVTDLSVNVYTHGQTVGMHGMIEYDAPVSFFKVPALK